MSDSDVKTSYQLAAEMATDPTARLFGAEGVGIDPQLQGLVSMVNESSSLSFGITLFTSTGIITGNLISRKSYFEIFGESLANSFQKAIPDEDWSGFKERYVANGNAPVVSEDEYEVPPQFVHLNQASSIREDGSWLVKGGMLWRGKIQSVNGFTLGRFTHDT